MQPYNMTCSDLLVQFRSRRTASHKYGPLNSSANSYIDQGARAPVPPVCRPARCRNAGNCDKTPVYHGRKAKSAMYPQSVLQAIPPTHTHTHTHPPRVSQDFQPFGVSASSESAPKHPTGKKETDTLTAMASLFANARVLVVSTLHGSRVCACRVACTVLYEFSVVQGPPTPTTCSRTMFLYDFPPTHSRKTWKEDAPLPKSGSLAVWG